MPVVSMLGRKGNKAGREGGRRKRGSEGGRREGAEEERKGRLPHQRGHLGVHFISLFTFWLSTVINIECGEKNHISG